MGSGPLRPIKYVDTGNQSDYWQTVGQPKATAEYTTGDILNDTTYYGSVYLSGPITGMRYDDARFGWRLEFAKRMKSGIKVLSPMRHEGHLAEVKTELAKDYPKHFFSGARVLVEKDRLDIKRSEVMVVNLLGATKVSIGTVSEIGMAYEMGKTIVLVIEDDGNVHDHPFVTVPAALRLNNLDDAIDAVNSLMSEGV